MRAALVSALALLSACASTRARLISPAEVDLKFKGRVGEVTDAFYASNSRSRTYQGDQILRDHTESVDFAVRNRVTAVTDGTITSLERTIAKDGSVELHDLAFPELNEEIELVISDRGRVLKAGNFPPHSLFFIPSLPVTDGPVRVGDTWEMTHSWLSGREGLPLKLDAIGILKAVRPCEKSGLCADVEVSGEVTVPLAPRRRGGFQSRLRGRILFSLTRGDVLWSEVRSREDLVTERERTTVDACMVSHVAAHAAIHGELRPE